MKLHHAKQLIAGAGTVVGVLAVACALVLGSFAVIVTGTGANPRDAFTETTPIPASLAGRVTWTPDAADLARSVEPQTRIELESAWVEAFAALEAGATGRSALDTMFQGRALDTIRAQLATRGATAGPVAHDHRLTVHFYSEDGQIVALSSQTRIEHPIPGGTLRSTDSFDAVLVLADGNWRILQIERTRTLIER